MPVAAAAATLEAVTAEWAAPWAAGGGARDRECRAERSLYTLCLCDWLASVVGERYMFFAARATPLFSRTVFTGHSRCLNPVTAKICYLLLYREFQIVPY